MSLSAFFNQNKMLCPKCVESGEKSSVYYRSGSTTLVAFSPFYDEDGEYHNHDTNKRVSNYGCSQGHWFSITNPNNCPNPKCDWKLDV